MSLIGAIRLEEWPTLAVHPGAVNAATFVDFIRSKLVPKLRPNDIVVMDNLSVHRTSAVRDAIEGAGAVLCFLPTYSPELNPIDVWWAGDRRQLFLQANDNYFCSLHQG